MKGMVKRMKGYKVFEPDWKCRGYQYKVGETFEEDVTPFCCKRGFHFCTELKDCFNYYSFDPNNKVAEIETLGEVDARVDGSKYCTNKIKIVREITWEEALQMLNVGKGCTGLCNSGNWNSGDLNSGDYNSGNWNGGDHNSGNGNSGDYNSGNWNSGDVNSGTLNSGDYNSGDHNSGDMNSGNWNSGDYNSGNGNSGDWNKTSFSSGCFNTKESKIMMFNKVSDWTFMDWRTSKARGLLNGFPFPNSVLEWIRWDDMTDEEKEQHPDYKTTGGYLKKCDESEHGQFWWNNLTKNEKDIIMSLPNFDAEIFEQITGVHIEEE